MHTLELARSLNHKMAVVMGSRPGMKYTGLSEKQVMEDAEAKAAAVRAFVTRHDPDIVFTIAGMASEAESLGAAVLIKESGNTVVVNPPLSDGADPAKLLSCRFGSSRFGDSRLCAVVLESIEMLSREFPGKPIAATLNGPLTLAGLLMGLDRMLIASSENPGYLEKVLEVATERILEFMEAQVQRGAGYVHVADPSASLLSPASFERLELPCLKKLFNAIGAASLPNHLHICGDTTRHLPLLACTGADAVSVDSMVDMTQASRLFGPSTGVCGNISSAGVLLRGTPEEVHTDTLRMLKKMSACGNYIPATSCSVPGETPAENLDAFLGMVRGT